MDGVMQGGAEAGWMESAFSALLGLNREAVRADAAKLRARYPDGSRRRLTEAAFGATRWKAATVGGLSGLVANPWAAVPAAAADCCATLSYELYATAVAAEAVEPGFLDDEEAVYDLLVPVFGAAAFSFVLGDLGVRGGQVLTRQIVRAYLSKSTLKAFKKVALKHFGLKVTQKAVISKSVPVVGALIGAGWNWGEVTFVRNRCAAWLEGRPVEVD